MKYAVLFLVTLPLLVFSMRERKESKKRSSGALTASGGCWFQTLDGNKIMVTASVEDLNKLWPVRPSKVNTFASSPILSDLSRINSDYIKAIDPFLRILAAKVSAPDPSLALERILGVPRFIKEAKKISIRNAYGALNFLQQIPLRSVINFSAYALLAELCKRTVSECKTDAQKKFFFNEFSTIANARSLVREFILVDHLMDVNLAETDEMIRGDAHHFIASDGSGYGIQIQATVDEPTPLTYHWTSVTSQKDLLSGVSGFGEIKDVIALASPQYAYVQHEPNIVCGWPVYFEKKTDDDSRTSVCIYDVNTNKMLWEQKNECSGRWGIIVSNDTHNMLYCALKKGGCKGYDLRKAPSGITYESIGDVRRVHISKDGERLALVEAGDPSSIRVYDTRASLKKSLYIGFFPGLSGAMSAEGDIVITSPLLKSGPPYTLSLYSLATTETSTLYLSEIYVCDNTTFFISPDSQWIAFVSEKKGLSLWPFHLLREGKALHAIQSWPWIKKGPIVFARDSQSIIFFYPNGERGIKRISFKVSDATSGHFEKWYRSSLETREQ